MDIRVFAAGMWSQVVKIEIITTGDEIINGVTVDTNTAWIAERVAKLGHKIVRHSSVFDDKDAIGLLCKEAASRAEVVICTGGLGTTVDDITIEAAFRAFKVKDISGISLPNRVGQAPGVQVRLGGTEFFFLPGVPKELYQIFDDSVMPWLASHAECVAVERVMRCFGLPESTIDEKLREVTLSQIRLSFRVKFPDVLLKVVATAKNVADAKALADAATEKIYEKLGEVIYGEGESSLSEVVGKMLAAKKVTIAVAESCTGGLLSSIITDVSGSSDYFERGIVSYSNRSKLELLGVSEEVLRANGTVSRDTAMAMAEGVRNKSGTMLGIGVTGIAGPGGGTPEKPVGTVHIALAAPDGVFAHEYHYNRDRIWFKQIVAAKALDLVRKHLLKL